MFKFRKIRQNDTWNDYQTLNLIAGEVYVSCVHTNLHPVWLNLAIQSASPNWTATQVTVNQTMSSHCHEVFVSLKRHKDNTKKKHKWQCTKMNMQPGSTLIWSKSKLSNLRLSPIYSDESHVWPSTPSCKFRLNKTLSNGNEDTISRCTMIEWPVQSPCSRYMLKETQLGDENKEIRID